MLTVVNVTLDKSIGARLNEFILILGLSQNAFAQSIGITKGYLNDVLKGRKGIGINIVLNTAKAYRQINIRWLLTGEGEMFEFEKIYTQPPDELPSGVAEGLKIEYLKPEGELERIKRLLREHEQRIRKLESGGE